MNEPNANHDSRSNGDTESAALAQRVRDELFESKSAGQLAQAAAANDMCPFSGDKTHANQVMATEVAPSQRANEPSQSATDDPPCLRGARNYVRRGWRVVPVPRSNGKAPNIPDWPKLQIAEADLPRYFGAGQNVGIILGESSAGLVDVDLDTPEAIAAAEKLLPPTVMVHGRAGKPRSHRWYIVNPAPATVRYQAPDGTTLCELRSTGSQTLVPPSKHPSGDAYSWVAEGDPPHFDERDLRQRLGVVASVAMLARLWPKTPANRHEIAMALAGFLFQDRMKRNGKSSLLDAVKEIVAMAAGIAGDEELKDRLRAVDDTATAIAAGEAVTGTRKLEELWGAAVVNKLRDWLDFEAPGEALVASVALVAPPLWPVPLGEQAYYGLVGEAVNTIEPHTESDPAAIVIQFLAAFGNVVGRSPFYPVEGDRHHTNLFGVLVGASSKARKGTSWGQVRRLLNMAAAPDCWVFDSIQSGLSSGEGLVWGVRDPGTAGEDDPGVSDKRLLVVETEFARPLVAMAREGNVLSELLRQSWDTGDLQILTKNNPAKATGAHISVIGHVTHDDLRRHLGTTQQANGFANRFLWVCAKRSKKLPEGGTLTDEAIALLADRLRDAILFAAGVAEMRRDDEARDLWRSAYPDLSEGRPGLLGAAISRAEAQVLRLSMIYALLDCSAVIRIEHLQAALAVWRYCEDSARYIFGHSLGDPVADKILEALRSRGPSGMTRTEIRDLFKRHLEQGQAAAAVASLQALGLARFEKEESDGRPVERWFATSEAAT